MTDFKNNKKEARISNEQNSVSSSSGVSTSSGELNSSESLIASNNLYPDRFVLSQGQDSPLINTLFTFLGSFPVNKTKIQRTFRSHNEGRQDVKFEIVAETPESLGRNALSTAADLALGDKRDNFGNKIYALLSGDELEKGSIWEAANFASFHKLGNLIAILDINHLSGSTKSLYGFKSFEYENRFRAFGFEAFSIDEDINDIDAAFYIAHHSSTKPVAIIVNSLKGKDKSKKDSSPIESKDSVQEEKSNPDQIEETITELNFIQVA